MPDRIQAVIFRPDRTVVRKPLRIDNGVVLNEKNTVGARINPDLVFMEERVGRVIRMKRRRTIVALRQDDADPISFRHPEKGFRSDTAKVQLGDLATIQREAQLQAREQGSKENQGNGIWYPVSIAGTVAVLMVMVMIGLRFWLSGGLDRVGGG